jgi:3-oxoacyl-[acyl-carrier protein] reductase
MGRTVCGMLSLQGKAAIVTGGSRGIGRATAMLLARTGARVAIGYREDGAAAQEVVSNITASRGKALAIQADLAAPDAAQELVKQAVTALEGLDILVVSHGIWRPAPAETMTREQWDETLAANLSGTAAVCRAAAAHMLKQERGAIVTVASTAGQRGEAGYSHYAASKGGILALTRSLASELAPRGIRVNCAAPGWVLTDMTRETLEGPEGQRHLSSIPLGRAATPEEIAGPIVFLASDLASFIHGDVLNVNGGSVMA